MIISICSEKGGVGKTTSAINIANGLVKLGKKVLIIDLDQQGNTSQALGFIKDGKPTIAEVIYNQVADIYMNISDSIRHTLNGLDYIPASPMLTNITSIISNDSDSNYVLKRCLNNDVCNQYDYIFLDCRTLLDLFVANAMNCSKWIIIPVENGVFSYSGLDKMINKVKSINNSTNRDLRVLGILLNKQQRTIIGTSIADSVREEFKTLTFKTVIPYCPAQVESSVVNQLSCVNDKNSSLGRAFLELSKEILEKTKN